MGEKLPKKLTHEPLIDAQFEVRFTSAMPASSLFPGLLVSQLPGDKAFEKLPTEQIPKAILESDPNLRFAPLLRIRWNRFVISLSDRSLAVGCAMPYPGWAAFKPAILQVLNVLKENGTIQHIHRFSMKYIDLLTLGTVAEQVAAINGTVVLGEHTLTKETFSLRIEVPRGELLHVAQIVSSAVATMPDGSSREGLIVDIDTICSQESSDFSKWVEQLSEQLELAHTANKGMFFECLRPETITSLGPEYD